MIDKKQPENVEYFNYLFSRIANDARCTLEIKCCLAKVKAAFDKNNKLKLKLNLRTKLVCYIWSTVLYGAETWTLREVDRIYLKSFEM
jgi:hypothetical protein